MRWPRALYDALVVLHVVSVGVGFGAIALTGLHAHDTTRQGGLTPEGARWFAPERGVPWSRLALWSVPVLGIALTLGHRRYALDQPWLAISLVAWIAALVVAQRVIWPAEEGIRDAVEHGRAGEPGFAAGCRRATQGAAVVDVLSVIALGLMLIKPGLPTGT